MNTPIKARVVQSAAGWTEPVLGPDGDQLRRPILGSGTTVAAPVWKHRTALRGEVVDLPVEDYRRLLALGAIEPVEDTPADPWGDAIGRFFPHARSQALQGPPVDDVTEESQDASEPVTEAQEDGKRVTVDDLPHAGGWYTLPDGEKVRGREAAEAALANLEG